MEFTWPMMLLAVGLVPLLWWGHRFLARRQRRTAEQFAEARLFEQLVVRPPSWQRSLPVACYLIAVLLLAVAMARPVAALPMPVNRAAVMVAIDTSKSMIATDISPSRLLRPGSVPSPPNPLDPRPNPDDLAPASIIIFSDGVNTFGPNPYEAAQLARDGKVRIFTIGMGTPGGTVMQIDGQTVLVPFDSAGLERIAQITDGRYFPSASAEELHRVYRQLGRVIGWERTRMEVSFLLLGVAGLLVLTGGALSMVWFRRVP